MKKLIIFGILFVLIFSLGCIGGAKDFINDSIGKYPSTANQDSIEGLLELRCLASVNKDAEVLIDTTSRALNSPEKREEMIKALDSIMKVTSSDLQKCEVISVNKTQIEENKFKVEIIYDLTSVFTNPKTGEKSTINGLRKEISDFVKVDGKWYLDMTWSTIPIEE